MMGRSSQDQRQLFYSFNLEAIVPDDHQVRAIARVLDLSWVRAELAPRYSHTGRPSIDPVLMIRMLIVGYVFAIRSERALCREVQLNLAYRWFCGLGIEDTIPDHSAFSRARNERFLDTDMFRRVFERVVGACIAAGLVGGEGFAVDASLIQADANKHRSIPGCRVEQEYRSGAGTSRGQRVSAARRSGLRRGKRRHAEVRLTLGPCRSMDGRAAQRSVLRLRRQLSHRREVRDHHGR